ncbi:MAG: tannase/feruloyl esterase family alpha/beta hydrolase [Acidobacteriota bacterium]|nr:tannase/feruloyl esterase family alpha/beta hydrolase [Acidobacteriota bacterium]
MRKLWIYIVIGFAISAVRGRAEDCSALAQLKLEETTITHTEVVKGTPATCRVSGVIRPTSDSEIRFEVWMPVTDWNGRFVGVGNGGFAGSIDHREMAAYAMRGYATAGSDAGHEAEGTDATWAYGHPEKVKDFGWRSVHVTRERSAQIVKAYYGKPETKAYFDSCSDGGREALMEAQRFPGDYDGILAGAPANQWSTLMAAGLATSQKLMVDPRAWIPPRKLPAIQRAVLAQCDALDGVKDGVVSDPANCHFNPDELLCKGADTSECLTRPQIASLKTIYAGPKNTVSEIIFPGMTMGDETGWRPWITGDSPGASAGAQFVLNDFRYVVTDDPTWNMLTANPEAMLTLSREKTAADLDSTDTNLGHFAAHGGKLILYHGWNDPAISPWSTVAYYNEVRKRIGAAKEDSFMRLYMIPGMEHCIGGPGASVFGQLGTDTTAGPKHGIFDALESWVERGVPNKEIIATKYSAEQKAEFTRPLCAYPKVAKYRGTGDTNDAANFACVEP